MGKIRTSKSLWRRCPAGVLALSVMLLGTWGSSPLLAQEAAQGVSGIEEVLRQQQREEALQERMVPRPDVRLEAPLEALDRFLDRESPCLVIGEVHLQGEAAERFGWVRDAATGATGEVSPLGRCLGTQGINLVLKRAQNALIERGFVTSRVLVDPQNLNDGTLALTLVPGRIASLRWAEPAPRRTALRNAVPARPGDILNLRDIEQALENFQYLPSVDVDIQIAPGEEPGTSDLVIAHEQGRPLRASASLDNHGSDATGRYLFGVTLTYDNPLGLNDLVYVALGKDVGGGDPGPHGSKSRLLHYSVPWGYWRFGLTASDYRYHQTVAGAFEDIDYRGNSRSLNATLSRLIYRDASRKTTASVGAFQHRSRNFIDDTEIEVQRRTVGGWEAGLSHREFLGRATLDAAVAYQRGTGAFGALPAPEEAFGDGTSRFQLIAAEVDASLPFQLGGQALRYLGHLRWQRNLTPLAPLERFSIGSRHTVRGFHDTSLVAERGWLVRNELEGALGDSGQALYAGLDYGQVGGASTEWLLGSRLAGAALGIRGTLWRHLHYDAFVAVPLKKPEGLRTDSHDLGLSVHLAL